MAHINGWQPFPEFIANFNITRKTGYAMLERHGIRHQLIGGRRFVWREDIDALLRPHI